MEMDVIGWTYVPGLLVLLVSLLSYLVIIGAVTKVPDRTADNE